MAFEPMLKRADSYDEVWRQVDWSTFQVPDEFNIGIACLDENDPGKRAMTIVHEDRSHTDYTYGELTELSNRFANVLRDRGIQRGDVVAIVKPQSLETAIAFMSIWRLGAVALPMSQLFGPDALAYRLENSGAKAVVTSATLVDKVREAAADDVTLIVVGSDDRTESWDQALRDASPDFEPVRTKAQDPGLLIYTSGTTGNPKGALHAHRIVFGQMPLIEMTYDFLPEPDDVWWAVADWAWIAGVMDVFLPAFLYASPIVVDEKDGFDIERALWLMREHKVSHSLLPATALRGIRSSGLPGGGFSFRAIMSGGEALGADLQKWSNDFFGAPVNDAYGQTEMNGLCCHNVAVFPTKPGATGRPGPGNVVVALGEDGEPLGVDQVGEIAVDSTNHPIVMIEYWKNPKATEEKFSGKWLLTGDLGRVDADGYVWFESRKDDVIKSSGYRIGPGEIEDCLGSHEAVAMSAVIGVPDERRGEVPKAFVVLRPGVEGSPELVEELRLHVRKRLAGHEVPREIDFVDDLPRTATGKIMRRMLKDPTP